MNERCGKRCPDGDWVGDKEPGGMECEDCGCIFISNEGRPLCKVCDSHSACRADEKKVTDLTEHRKKKLPVAQTAMRDIHDIVAELIATLEAQGSKNLIGSYMGGWSFQVTRASDNGEAPR